ncbi:MAG: hypothetical protein DRP79_01245 [Planctomycetota bacterium]|nr:MAG: hypothetical protein DRP79_01245 [Planctomycetota bacterium]
MALKGDLGTIQLADIFQTLANNQSRGTLVVYDKDSKKRIYFEGGRVTLHSSGTRKALRLGKILLGRKKITRNELDAALKIQEHSREHLGETLVGMGVITREEMNDAVKFQIEEEIYGLFTWKDAHFEFSPDLPTIGEVNRPSETISLSLNVQELVMEAARRADEWQTIAAVIPSIRDVYRHTGKAPKGLATEDLEAEETAELLQLFDGTRTVQEVSNETAYGSFVVCRALAKFIETRAVRLADVKELMEAAERFARIGDIDKCLKLYELAASRAPKDIAVQKAIARTYEQFGKGHMAAAKYNHVGELLLDENNQELAAKYFERSVSIHAADPEVLRKLLIIYSNLDDMQSSIRVGKRLAALYDELGKRDESKSVYEMLLELAPDDIPSRIRLLNIVLDGGQFAEAEIHYEKLAEDYLKLGRTGKAVAVLRKLLIIRPLRNDVRRKIETLLYRESRRKKIKIFAIVGIVALGFMMLAGGYEYKARSLRNELNGAIATAEQNEDYDTVVECYQMIINAYPFSITALQASKEIEEINKKKDLFYGKQIKLLTRSAREEEREGRLENALKVLARLREFAREDGLKQYAEEETARINKYIKETEDLWKLAQKYQSENRLKEVLEYNSKIYWGYPLSRHAKELKFPLLITSLPHGAEVRADGKLLGTTPYVLHYHPSRAPIVTISLPGFAGDRYDVATKVTQPSSEGWKLHVELAKTLRWKFKTSQPVEAPPVVFKKTLILGSRDGNLYCLYTADGRLKWKRRLGLMADVVSQPLLLGGRVYAGCFDGNLYCLDAVGGEVLWSAKAGGMLRAAPTTSEDGSMVFITSDAGKILAIDAKTGEVRWSKSTEAGIVCSAAPWRNKLFTGTLDGTLLCLSQKDGAVIWKRSLAGGVTGTPRVLNGKIYAGCMNGGMLCLDAKSGRESWRYESRTAIRSSPALVDGTLLFGNDGGWLFRLSASDGGLLWRYRFKGAIRATPTISAARGQVVCGATDGVLYALDLEAGSLRWKFRTDSAIYSKVLSHGGRFYFGSNDHHLYSIEE